MRIIISFFLSLIFFIGILSFLFFAFFKKNVKKKEVLIHTAVIVETSKKTKPKPYVKKVVKQTPIKKRKVKIGSKNTLSKSGEVDFNDIFKNVKANVPTTPVKLKKEEEISRLKGDILKDLKIKTLQTVDIKISFSNNKNKDDKDIKKIIQKIDSIWNEISDNIDDYALIKLDIINGKINVIILDSNLNLDKQQLLINKIKELSFNKNLSLKIKFVTKAKK